MGIIGLVMLLGLVLNGCGGGDGGGGSGGGGSGGGGGNTAPQPAAAAITTSTNTPGTSQISVNDSDVGQTFTFVLTTPPQNGTATVSAAGLVTFTPRAGFTGSDQLTVTVTDNGSPPLSGTVTISLTVQAPPSASRIVGRLLVPPNNAVEVEPNNVISQAQTLSSTATVSGSAARGEPGFLLPGFTGVVLQDLYQVTTTGKVRITLTIATDDLDANDLDLVLMNSAGTLLDVSEGFVATETLDIPGAGTFLVGIRAFAGSSAYILSFTTPEGRTSSQAALVPSEAEFVAGDILVKFRPDKINLEQQTTAFTCARGNMVDHGTHLKAMACEQYQAYTWSGEVLTRGADGQGGVQHTFLLPQVIGQLLNLCRRSANEDHLGTQVVVEVHMGGSQDRVIIVVLQLDEFFAELPDVMVVDQCDGAQRFLLGVLPFVRYEVIADHIPHELRAVGVALLLHQGFQPLQQRLR